MSNLNGRKLSSITSKLKLTSTPRDKQACVLSHGNTASFLIHYTVFNAVLRDMHSRKVAAEERSEQRSNELEQKMEQMMEQKMEQMKTEMGRVNKQSNERLEHMLKDSVKRLEKELEDMKQELKDTRAELKDMRAELAKEKEITRNLQSSLSALMHVSSLILRTS